MAAVAPSTSSRGRTRDPERRELIIGNFTRLNQIGQGSFAIVYKAKHVVSQPVQPHDALLGPNERAGASPAVPRAEL